MQQVMQQVQDTLLPMVQTVNAYLSDYILVGLLIAVGADSCTHLRAHETDS